MAVVLRMILRHAVLIRFVSGCHVGKNSEVLLC